MLFKWVRNNKRQNTKVRELGLKNISSASRNGWKSFRAKIVGSAEVQERMLAGKLQVGVIVTLANF